MKYTGYFGKNIVYFIGKIPIYLLPEMEYNAKR